MNKSNNPLSSNIHSALSFSSSSSPLDGYRNHVFARSPLEPTHGKIEMNSKEFYAASAAGGALACGLTHTSITPLDVIKCNMQIDPTKYKSTMSGFNIVLREEGIRGFFKGWTPTLIGYSMQVLPPLRSLLMWRYVRWRLSKFGFSGLSDGLPKIVRSEGFMGFYKGLLPLWGRQVPYNMMKFASFENIVELIYKKAIKKPKEDCSKPFQLGISFLGGYTAGILCAVVSHPADNLVSFLNNSKGATVGDAVKNLGLLGLFTRGLPLRIGMIGTLTGLQWGIVDSFKVFVGLPTTGGVSADTTSEEHESSRSSHLG